jgi:F-box/TPR repeat protein Pof3
LQSLITLITDSMPCSLGLDDTMHLMSSNASLEAVSINYSAGSPSIRDEHASSTLPKLSQLEIYGVAHASSLLKTFNLPALQKLLLSRIADPLDEAFACLVECEELHLTDFTLQHCTFNVRHLLDLLRKSRSIHSLTLNHISGVANEVVEALAEEEANSDAVLCPAVEYLDVSHCPDVKTGTIRRLLIVRNGGVEAKTGEKEDEKLVRPPISTLYINGCPLIEAPFIPIFRRQVKLFSCVYLSKKAANYRR